VPVVSAALDCDPLMPLVPDQPPEAVQAVALMDDQVSLDVPPLATVLGLALKLAVTEGCVLTETVADCAAVPPTPVQVKM
jgi:hypothetical protein